MRVRFNREWEGHGQGLVTDLDDERGRKAVGEDAAEEMRRVRPVKDFRHGGQTFAAHLDADMTADQYKAAVEGGAVKEETAGPVRAADGGGTVPEPSPEAAPRRTHRRAEG